MLTRPLFISFIVVIWCSSDFAPPLVSQQPNVIAGVACHLIYQHHLCSYSQCTDGSWGILGYVRMPHLSSVLKPPRPRPWCMCIRCFLLFIWCTSKPTDYMHSRGGGGSDSRCTQENLLSEMVWYINTHTHVRWIFVSSKASVVFPQHHSVTLQPS